MAWLYFVHGNLGRSERRLGYPFAECFHSMLETQMGIMRPERVWSIFNRQGFASEAHTAFAQDELYIPGMSASGCVVNVLVWMVWKHGQHNTCVGTSDLPHTLRCYQAIDGSKVFCNGNFLQEGAADQREIITQMLGPQEEVGAARARRRAGNLTKVAAAVFRSPPAPGSRLSRCQEDVKGEHECSVDCKL